MADAAIRSHAPRTIQVWDPVVRIGHWVLVGGFAVAYLTEGEPQWLHVWAGYAVAATVVLRLVWGFVGPEKARFSDFVTGPRRALNYLRGLMTGTSPRYLGHSPAGGLMTLALLAALAGVTSTGMILYAQEENAGPLAPWYGGETAVIETPALLATAHASENDREEHSDYGERHEGEETIEELHEVFANATVFLIVLHVAGVLIASRAHDENLVRAMIDGRKRP